MEQTLHNSYSENQPNDQGKESIFLTFILLLAFGGLIFLHTNDDQDTSELNANAHVVRTVAAQSKPAHRVDNAATTKEKISGKLLTFSRQPEAFQPFTFRLVDFSQNTRYQLETGDGTLLDFVNGEAQYTYKRHGSFYGKIYATYNNQTITIDERTITVAPGLVTASVPGLDY